MFQKPNPNNLFNKIKYVLSITIFVSLFSTSAAAVEIYKEESLQIQTIQSGNIIELNNGSIWEVVPEFTFDPKIICITCYISEHWSQGDHVDVVYQSGNYGAFTHYIKNQKDKAKAAVNEYYR